MSNRLAGLSLVVGAGIQLSALSSNQAFQDDTFTPAPGKVMRINFPDMPKSLLALATGNDIPTAVLVRLPDNYNSTDSFPLYVFLEGGYGGAGSEIGTPMQVSNGGDGVIVASFPLFKKHYDTTQRWPFAVGFEDFDAVSAAYKTILDRMREIIPNIDPDRSILGGHSNGAKTIATLLSGLDENTLASFRGFFFIDDGLEWTGINRPNKLGDHHIFFLIGGGGTENDPWWRKHFVNRVAFFQESARELGMKNWKFETYDGVGHEFAQQYFAELRAWAKSVGPTED